MLSRIRKNKDPLHHADPAVRRQAVEALAAPKLAELQTDLSALAASDPDASVRAACIAQLEQPQALAPLLDTPAVAQLAAMRIAELLANTDSPSLADPLLAHPRLVAHPRVLPLVLPTLPAKVALPLVADVDEASLIGLCIGVRGDVREAMLARITSAKSLTALERHSRDHDKSVNRYARAGLERVRQARQAASAAMGRLGELLDALERFEPGSPQRQHALHQQLQTTHEELLAQHAVLQAAAELPEDTTVIDERMAVLPPPPPLKEANSKAEANTEAAIAQPSGPSPFVDLVEQFQALRQSMASGGALEQIKAQRQNLTDAWLQAADQRQPTSAQHEVFETVSHAYQQFATSASQAEEASTAEFAPLPTTLPDAGDALKALWREATHRRKALQRLQTQLEKIHWPDWAQPSNAYQDLQQRAKQLESELLRLRDHEAHVKADLSTLINTLVAEIEAGSINKAANTLSNARRLSRALPPRAAEDLLATLNVQAAKFTELRDWQTFATSPKRQALCEQIKEIAEHPLAPKDQADRIKHLRSDWNQLGPVSKREDRKLAEQFNQLAETAFEPCRSYFAEQAEIRQANLEQRRLLCEQLSSYLESTHWEAADMKAAEQILRTARSEWRRYHPVERNPGKPLETRFEALQEQLHQRIKDAWDTNLQSKQAIVREAEALVAGDSPVVEKIDQAKSLQQRWQQVGITPRKPDQQLWQAFRQACDAIFAQRDAAREQADQSLQQALAQSASLLTEIRTNVDEATPATAQREFIRNARSRFAQLPQIPERPFRDAQRDFDELMRRYSTLLDQRAANERLDQLRQLQSWDHATTEFEHSRAAGAGQAHVALAPCFENRLANPDSPVSMEVLKEHAIAAELLAGMPSPQEDQALRLKLQVDQLKAGMGKNLQPPEPLQLAQDWCALGPKCWGPDNASLDTECDVLRERVFVALEKVLAS